MEISDDIVNKAREEMKSLGIDVDVRKGSNSQLNFDDNSFDYIVSWNECYYLDDDLDFSKHVVEFARVLKPNGVMLFSIPCKDCFVYKNAEELPDGLMRIRDDYFNLRNGSIQRVFTSEAEIEMVFGNYFDRFIFGKIDDDCFGLAYKWYIGCCRKKEM